jgi:hypothetical protein
MEDVLYEAYVGFLQNGVVPLDLPSTKSNFISTASKYFLSPSGVLMRNMKRVLKESELDEVWRQMHNHSGRSKCWERINERFYFRGGERWVREKTRSCVSCAHKNGSTWEARLSPLCPIKCTPKVFWRIHCDLMGPFPESASGCRYVGVAVCGFSKYVEAMGNRFTYTNYRIMEFSGFIESNFDRYCYLQKMSLLYFSDSSKSPC